MTHGGIPIANGTTSTIDTRHPLTGRTALHEAVVAGNLDFAKYLLEVGGADPNIGHVSQGPPLLHAAAFGHRGLTELLLRHGAAVSDSDLVGCSALHYACGGGHVDVAQLLLRFGANLTRLNSDGKSPFDVASPQLKKMLIVASHPPSSSSSSSSS
eukprot:CAMPEP_0175061294 /NCGR_PEP_ID=MMETSP0052_2-20121109/13504_1 /TAXON_ID=51329 ORGANISM="Polytomella parva, Strain SAG 63-3" /NCGR_SAMPLE_ID=MMETSP0052_2 /ASSEMBLY_ACC=CAM_ASM_000194 /LENGTH=155 /DNA_ID=CAMNT_0016327131 /DNA_START=51 /DNA_END=514 /DNA_ORIENTATION=+